MPFVLVVEDYSGLRDLAEAFFAYVKGIDCLTAKNAEQALKIYNQNKDSISAVVTEVEMRFGINGIQLTEELLKLNPDLPVYVLSYERSYLFDAIAAGAKDFFPKGDTLGAYSILKAQL